MAFPGCSAIALAAIAGVWTPSAACAEDNRVGHTRAGLHAEARYRVDLIEVKARDETGIDAFGSDEIVIYVESKHGDLLIRGFDDMDSGETVTVPAGHSCLVSPRDSGAPDGVWGCSPEGAALPISLDLTVFEKDGVGRAAWELFTTLDSDFCVSGRHTGDIGPDCNADQHLPDDRNAVGSVRFALAADTIGTLLVGETRRDNLVVDACSKTTTIDHAVCSLGLGTNAWNGVYRLSLVTTRLPDVAVSDLVDLDTVRHPLAQP